MRTTKDYWTMMERGHWAGVVGGVRFEVCYDPEAKLWRCSRDGKEFDAGRTLAEAKGYCNE